MSPTNFSVPPASLRFPSRMALMNKSTLLETPNLVLLRPTQSLSSNNLGFTHFKQGSDFARHWSDRPLLHADCAGMHFGTHEDAKPTMPRPMKPWRKFAAHRAQPGDTWVAFRMQADVTCSASEAPPNACAMIFFFIIFWSHSTGVTSSCRGRRTSAAAALAMACGSSSASSPVDRDTILGTIHDRMPCSTVGSSCIKWCLKDLASRLKQPARLANFSVMAVFAFGARLCLTRERRPS
mmetsp:Transcript_42459/g.121016  ORF Transcript_42459/g.121016 Transcript_42459/m.121016 type:complete len:238 (+) Transcript_42459:201-914(+)